MSLPFVRIGLLVKYIRGQIILLRPFNLEAVVLHTRKETHVSTYSTKVRIYAPLRILDA